MPTFAGDAIAAALLVTRESRQRQQVRSGRARLHLEPLPSGAVKWAVWHDGVIGEGVWFQRDVHRRIGTPQSLTL